MITAAFPCIRVRESDGPDFLMYRRGSVRDVVFVAERVAVLHRDHEICQTEDRLPISNVNTRSACKEDMEVGYRHFRVDRANEERNHLISTAFQPILRSEVCS